MTSWANQIDSNILLSCHQSAAQFSQIYKFPWCPARRGGTVLDIDKNKARPAGIPRLPHHRHLEGKIHWWGMLFRNSVCKCNCGSRCWIFLCINCYWIYSSGSLCVDSNWISCPGFSRLTAVKIWGLKLFQTQNSSMLGRSVSQVWCVCLLLFFLGFQH